MKVTLNDGRVCQIGVCYGDEQPKLERQPKIKGRYRSIRINLTIFNQDGQIHGKLTGVSYCSPADPFSRFEGRKRAMKRLFQSESEGAFLGSGRLLSVNDRRQLAPILLARKVQVDRPIKMKRAVT